MSARCAIVFLALSGALWSLGCGDDPDRDAISAEPAAGRWETWVLSSPSEVRALAPPAKGSERARRDAVRLRSLSGAGLGEEKVNGRSLNGESAVRPWLEQAMELVSLQPKDPPAASRAYALVSVAMADAAVAAYHWKYRYHAAPQGDAPDPSYPSAQAAVAGAAVQVLAYAYPEFPRARLEQMASGAAQSRVAAGVSTPSDELEGLRLGRAVGRQVVDHARDDGFTRKWHGRRPQGRGYWAPPPGSVARPVQPLAGGWDTWIISSGRQFRPPPPPRLGSDRMQGEAQELIAIKRRLTGKQRRVASFWAGGDGTELPPGIWLRVLLAYLRDHPTSTPRAARAFALLSTAMADAGVAAWDAKYAYWSPRPENAIRDLGLDPGWKPYLPTPFFPSYVSGHAVYSGAAAEVLAHLFPDEAELWFKKAREAGVSRLYGGIHFRSDTEVGMSMGRRIGRLAVKRAREDGAGE